MADDSSEIAPFRRSIIGQWIYIVSGSVVAAVWTVWGYFSPQLPVWLALVFIVTGVALAIYLAGRKEHRERMKLYEQLRPKLTITGVGPHSSDHRRIMVRNLTGKTIRFRTKLVASKPPLPSYPLPVGLQATHSQEFSDESEVGPYGDQPVDVFVDAGPPHPIQLKMLGNPPCLYGMPRDQRLEIQLFVYPISESGEGVKRWFYLVPQRDGSVVFGPDGLTKTSISATQP
jgi:hypothetical protein